MGYKVDSLQLELTVTAKQTASSLNRVANALKKIKDETKDMSAFAKLRKELNSFSKVNLTPIADALKTIASSSVKAREKLSQMLAEAGSSSKITSEFEGIGNKEFLDSFTSEIQEATTEVDDLVKTINASAEGVIDAFEPVGNAEFLKSFQGATKEMLNFEAAGNPEFLRSFETSMGMVSDAASRISGAEKDADDAAKRFKETLKEQGDEQARIIKLAEKELSELKATNKELDKTGKAGKRSMLGLEKSIGGAYKALKRFAKYAGYRAIRTSFNAITTSFSEGLESAYMWSAEAENGFSSIADTMNELATNVSQVKRQLGAVAGEIMTKIGSALNTILNGINAVADSLTEFFAALNGEDTYMRAKRIDTTWKDIGDDEKDATKAAKDYKKELFGIDELNVLGKDQGKSGAKEEEIKEPEYELAKVNRKSFAFELGANIKDVLFNWDDLNGEQIALKVCGALGALTGFVIGTSIGGVTGGLAGAAVGFVLGIAVGTILFDAEKAKYTPTTAKQDIINTVFGGTAGAAIGFAVGGPLGAAIGLTIGTVISLAVNAINTTYEEKIFEEYQKTEFWDSYREFMDVTLPEQLSFDEDIKAGISLDLEDTEVTNLEVARDLILEIFDLDEIENKTPEQIEELKTKIDTLNGMNLDGVRVEFDELTGAVTTSKEELLQHVDAMISNAKVQAGMEKYIELLKIAKEAEAEKIKRDKILKEKQDEQKKAYDALAGAQARYNLFSKDIADATELAQKKYGLYNAELVLGEEVYKELLKQEKKARDDIAIYTLAVNDATEAVSLEEAEVQKMVDAKIEAEENAEIMLGLVNDEKAAFNKETKAIDKNDTALGELDDATSDYTETLGELGDGLADVKDQMGKTKNMSPKLQKAIESIRGSFKDLKTSIAESISELGKLDEAGKTKRTIEVDYAVGANMNDAAMMAMLKGMGITTRASGGFVEGGHLFFANENGNPEYIGNMGGTTAVANSDQMSAAIEQAAYAGMARALQQYGNNNNGSEWQAMSGEEMYLMLKKKATSASRRTGVSVAF